MVNIVAIDGSRIDIDRLGFCDGLDGNYPCCFTGIPGCITDVVVEGLGSGPSHFDDIATDYYLIAYILIVICGGCPGVLKNSCSPIRVGI